MQNRSRTAAEPKRKQPETAREIVPGRVMEEPLSRDSAGSKN